MSLKSSLDEVAALERENARLKRIVGEHERQILTDLRAITLSRENAALRELVSAIRGQSRQRGLPVEGQS